MNAEALTSRAPSNLFKRPCSYGARNLQAASVHTCLPSRLLAASRVPAVSATGDGAQWIQGMIPHPHVNVFPGVIPRATRADP